MDIERIENIAKVSGVKRIASLDPMCIAGEAERMELYVEMLKEMPDVREDVIVTARAEPDPKAIAKALLQ